MQHYSALGDGGDADTRPAALAVHEHCRVVAAASIGIQAEKDKRRNYPLHSEVYDRSDDRPERKKREGLV